jgi:hypothetical protein
MKRAEFSRVGEIKMKQKILQLAVFVLMLMPQTASAVGLTPNASRMEIIKYTAIFIIGCAVMFFLLIRMTIIPFLVRSYYSLSDATNIGLSLFIIYALNLFTLLFFGLYSTGLWRALFCFIAVIWIIHLLLKVLLTRRTED